jgi:hypothetical protein
MLVTVDIVELSETVNRQDTGFVVVGVPEIHKTAITSGNVFLGVAEVVQLIEVALLVVAGLGPGKGVRGQDL